MRLLLADNNQAFLNIAQNYFGDQGHEAETAADGLECMARLREFIPDVLVLDQDLLWGGSDGVLSHLADDAVLSRISIVLSGDGDICNSLIASSLPATWLTKPYRLSDLLAHVQSAIRRRFDPRIAAAEPSERSLAKDQLQ
jgi:DNA-binding response OmpR family regulator